MPDAIPTEQLQGQQGTVIAVAQKLARMERMTGERWAYTMYFDDGMTWTYNAVKLELATARSIGTPTRARA